MVNLTPGAFEGNRSINILLTDPWSMNDLDAIASYTAGLLRKNESEGNLKWNYTKAVVDVLEGTRAGTLSNFIPEKSPLKLYCTSDSTLTMFTKSITRSWETMWNENRQAWARHIAEAHFSVIDGAKITAINQGLVDLLNRTEPNRGTQRLSQTRLSL